MKFLSFFLLIILSDIPNLFGYYLTCKKVFDQEHYHSDKIVAFLEEKNITLIDDVYQITLPFIKVDKDSNNQEFKLYEKKDKNFTYTAMNYDDNKIQIQGKNNIDNLIIKKVIFKCDKRS